MNFATVKYYDCICDNHCELTYINMILDKIRINLSDEYNIIIAHPDNTKSLKHFNKNQKNIVILIGDECEKIHGFDEDYFLLFRTMNYNCHIDYKKIFPIPLGFALVKKELNGYISKYIPEQNKSHLKNRDIDLFFRGHVCTYDRYNLTKYLSQLNLPNTILYSSDGFKKGVTSDEYLCALNNTKISFVPNGVTHPESFRFFESFESYCIVVTSLNLKNPKFNLWYYQNCPAIQTNEWNELSLSKDYIKNLLSNDILSEYFVKNKNYYDTCLSTDAVANYILNKIL